MSIAKKQRDESILVPRYLSAYYKYKGDFLMVKIKKDANEEIYENLSNRVLNFYANE